MSPPSIRLRLSLRLKCSVVQRLAPGAKATNAVPAPVSAATPPILAFTGERFAPEITGPIWYEHWHRYCLVEPLVAGRVVLDAACGEGYGSALLARAAREGIGVRIAAEFIRHPREPYTATHLR